MDGSVYTPGAGNLPRVLAGRDALLHRMDLLLNDVAAAGRPRAQDLILIGPRGVGKTVTLTTLGAKASALGFEVVNLQAVAGRGGLIEALLQRAASRIDAQADPWTRAKSAFDRIASVGFGVAGFSAEVSLRQTGERAVLDPSTLAEALVALADEVRRDHPAGGVLLTVDELQVGSAGDLALLAATLHRLNVDYPAAAVLFAGTGLPHTTAVLKDAGVTHPDRLFVTEDLPIALSRDDATFAVVQPAQEVGVMWHPDAAATVVDASNGYPAHLQLFADGTWQLSDGPHITVDEARRSVPVVEADIARRTLGPRWDAMPDRQMEYLAALAVLGGRSSTNRVARTLGRALPKLSSVRDDLLREGDVYSPQRGRLELTMPAFGRFVLERYEEARALSETSLLSLEEMRRNADPETGTPTAPGPHE